MKAHAPSLWEEKKIAFEPLQLEVAEGTSGVITLGKKGRVV
jgi:hypothetical protein